MAGFVSGGRSWGGSVVSRVGAGGLVWSVRVPSRGRRRVPASLCVPFGCMASASVWARLVAGQPGWRVVVRRAKRSAGQFEVKVTLPLGLSVSKARLVLPLVP
ncbi:MAG: hypothetical protein GY703_06605 [Gammaproteobacteria bacterium]|nr:hypothetical protein [Gammaproteobacteria bacterium]